MLDTTTSAVSAQWRKSRKTACSDHSGTPNINMHTSIQRYCRFWKSAESASARKPERIPSCVHASYVIQIMFWQVVVRNMLRQRRDRGVFDMFLTRAPLGYFYNAPHWGGAISSPPLISETTGPILKIQAAFEKPGKTVKGKQILLTSGSRVTSQVRSKSKCSTFRAWWHRRAKLRC